MTPSLSPHLPCLPWEPNPSSEGKPSPSTMLQAGETENATLCSCYAPVSLLGTKSCSGGSVSKGATATTPIKDHANGQGAPPPPPPSSPLKSNLKKPTGAGEQQHQEQVMVRDGKRKVSWPDAHGRDLAHVQIFHSSVLEEGEFALTGKSCICIIQ